MKLRCAVSFRASMKALSTAEDAVHTQRNVYSLRGAKVRSADNWATYLREANDRWGGEAEVLYAQHHWPIWGKERISEHLTKQSARLQVYQRPDTTPSQ
jgi:alkyl sulfatase BDS1-like metallo-beta-lactamase superfamily hydrolase